MSRVVGKNVLESLTTGMYSKNQIVFREYIQNSADAIDKAIADGILEKNKNQIDIFINQNRRQITIKDNGTGIPSKEVFNTLGDIGKSQKDYKSEKGFRGIGRLGGLGYCEELQFITSFKGESIKTITTWDCIKLKELLRPSKAKNMDVIEVVNAVTTERTEEENSDNHYFEVILTGIDKDNENLLDLVKIEDYLAQVSPVPYNFQRFSELKRVKQKLIEKKLQVDEYNIFLNKEQIYKPYRNKVKAGKSEKEFIRDISFFEGYKDNGDLFFLGWYGITDLSGMIKDGDVNGIRVRKHNILIGDNHSLDSFFGNNSTYQAFNRWFVGEIYVFENDLIPNARRDDFEKNKIYTAFKKEVEKTTYNVLRKLPHSHSKERSEKKAISTAEKTIDSIKTEIKKGLTTIGKHRLIEKIENTEKRVKKITGNRPKIDKNKISDGSNKNGVVLEKKGNVLDDLKKIKTEVEKSNHFKTDRIPTSYPKTVRKIVQRIFEVIDTALPEGQAQELQELIIEELSIDTKSK